MLAVAAMSGWSASSRSRHSRISHIVDERTKHYDRVFLGKRALLGRHRCRRFIRFITNNAVKGNSLLVIGKSLGARNLIEYVLNPMDCYLMIYDKVLVLTVDPCWPSWDEWRPNRNDEPLKLTAPVDKAINIYLSAPTDEQAGAPVVGAENWIISDSSTTHRNIVMHPWVKVGLNELLEL